MARRVFNNCIVNGVTISAKEFVQGSGEIMLTGQDTSRTTDDHIMHNLRLNEKHTAKFQTFRDHSELETEPRNDVFGGPQIFLLDSEIVDMFDGVVSVEFDEKGNSTMVTVSGEVEDG
jgi:hypothetical protein